MWLQSDSKKGILKKRHTHLGVFVFRVFFVGLVSTRTKRETTMFGGPLKNDSPIAEKTGKRFNDPLALFRGGEGVPFFQGNQPINSLPYDLLHQKKQKQKQKQMERIKPRLARRLLCSLPSQPWDRGSWSSSQPVGFWLEERMLWKRRGSDPSKKSTQPHLPSRIFGSLAGFF